MKQFPAAIHSQAVECGLVARWWLQISWPAVCAVSLRFAASWVPQNSPVETKQKCTSTRHCKL